MHSGLRISVADNSVTKTRHTYYPLLDYLRGLAALGVFISHSDTWHIFPESFGNACVQIFFSLSGFLIGGILLEASPNDIPRFYFNRSTRIWIPYFIALSLVLVVTILKQPLTDSKLWEILFYKLTFTYNLFGTPQLALYVDRFPLQGTANHFWSICVEEQFYLLAPFVVIFLRSALVWFLAAAIALNLFYPHDFASISVGLLLVISRRRFGAWYVQSWARVALLAALAAILFYLHFKPDIYAEMIPAAAGSIVALFASTGRQHDLGRVVGGISFSFYLNTWVVFFALNYAIKLSYIQLSPAIASATSIGLALGFSCLHYFFIDRTIIRSRNYLYSRDIGYVSCCIGFVLCSIGITIGLSLLAFR